MAVREVIEIDEELCDGCGECVTACAEGALAIVDGKARLLSDVYCDGLGACLGECPRGAISIVRRQAADFDEQAVERHLSRNGAPTATSTSAQGLPIAGSPGPACPGAKVRSWALDDQPSGSPEAAMSQLRQWPIQLHLLSPSAPFLRGADVLLAADCVAYAVAGFHARFLNGHRLAIACPKLDSHQGVYLDKLVEMIDSADVRSVDVMVMEVPCCSGLVGLVQQARERARRKVEARCVVVGVGGEVLAERAL